MHFTAPSIRRELDGSIQASIFGIYLAWSAKVRKTMDAPLLEHVSSFFLVHVHDHGARPEYEIYLVRLAAFRLIEAGLEVRPGIESTFPYACI